MGCSDRDVSDLVEEQHGPHELQLWNLHSIRHHQNTGTSTTLSKSCRTAACPAPPHPSTIQEPTWELPGAALDRSNKDRRIALYGLGRPRELGHSPRRVATPNG